MKPRQDISDSFEILDLLTRLGHEELQNLARRFGLVASSPSRRALSAQVLARYRDPDFIRDTVQTLNRHERDLLGFLLLMQDQLEAGVRWPVPRIPSQHPVTSPSTFQTLVECGLVFRHPEERTMVLVPSETVPAIRQALLADSGLQAVTAEEPLWGGTERIVWMLFRLLVAAHLGRLRQTQDESLVKRDVETWAASLPPDLFPPGGVPHDVGIHQVAGFLLSAARRLGIIHCREGAVRATGNVQDVLSQPRHGLLRALWTFFLERIAVSNPGWYPFLFRAVYCDKAGKVLPKTGSTKLWEISPRAKRLECGSLAVWLSWFGAVRVAKEDKRAVAIRTGRAGPWEPAGEISDHQPPGAAVLQPNFELIVPPNIPLNTLWEVERFADHHRTDVVSIYLLTRRSIIRGLRDGFSREEIWRRLIDLTSDRIPQNVRFSLEEWFDSFGKVQVEEVVILRCRSPEVAEEILHICDAAEAIRERLGPTLLVADRSRLPDLLETLERLGMAPIVHRPHADKQEPN